MEASANEAISKSAGELAGILRNELDRLSIEDRAIAQLIDSFNLLLRELKAASGRKLAREFATSLAAASRNAISQPIEGSIGNQADSKLAIRQQEIDTDYELRRACRIALMETDEPKTTEEIYSRIVRRGSFKFDNPEIAIAATARILDLMSKEGEASIPANDPPARWQRAVAEQARV